MMNFFERIKTFNKTYGLPAPSTPQPIIDEPKGLVTKEATIARLKRFKEILLKEIDEVDDIVAKMATDAPVDEVLTDVADWLGDIIVYSASESLRFGLPTEHVLDIIMDSNQSKLGADGKPIVEHGKVVKGPNYWKPEPQIRQVIQALMRANQYAYPQENA